MNESPMWSKILRYYGDHIRDPDSYPEWRNTWQWSEFMNFLHEFMDAIFGKNGIFNQVFVFFLNQPVLDFLLCFACAFGAFSLIKRAIKASRV